MTQRKRKFFGTIALLVMIFLYSLMALAVAVVLQVNEANHFVELIYYVVAGLAWVLPAGVIISWMQKADS